MKKRILSLLLTMLLLLPQGEFALAASGEEMQEPQAGETDQWAGFEEFSSAVSELLEETADEHYISAITLEIDSSEMTVNGEVQPVIDNRDAAPIVKDDVIMLPVRALPDREDAAVTYDAKTKTATVRTEDGEISFTQGEVTATINGDDTEGEFQEVLSAEPELVDGTMYVPLENMADFLGYEAEMVGERIVLTKPYQTKRLIVKSASDDLEDYGAIKEISGFQDLHIFQYETEQEAKDAQREFMLSGEVEYVEPDLVVYGTEAHKSWGTDSIEADTYNQFLQENTDLDEVVVAVVDSGVDRDHEFLQGRVIPVNQNFVDTSPSSYDDNGHGTHVSGIIRDATLSNVKILPVKVLNAEGGGTATAVYNGLMFAVSQECDVINASLGGFGTSSLMEEAVLAATENNIPMVIAAGNDCMDALTGSVSSIDQAIVVGALDETSHYAEYSNYGQTVDIWAPGSNILSSVPGGGFEKNSGTSMASPLAAAVAAMLKTYDSTLSPRQIEVILSDYALDLSISEPNNSGTSKVLSAQRLSQFTAAEKQEVVAMPVFSEKSGYYCQDSLTIELTCETEDAEIRYTTDGTVPTETTGILYTGPVTFRESVQVTVRAFKDSWIDSYKDSATYFISQYPESMHNYAYSYYQTWRYTYPDSSAKYLKVTFDEQTYLPYPDPELAYANWVAKNAGWGIAMRDWDGTIANEYRDYYESVFIEGELSGKDIILKGNSFLLMLIGNLSSTDFGFKITNIEPIYDERLPAPSSVIQNNENGSSATIYGTSWWYNDFESPRPLTLTSEEGAEIYYTLDGSMPDKSSTLYTGPIVLDEPALVRAKAYQDGWVDSKVSKEFYMTTSRYPESLHYRKRDEPREQNVWTWRAPADVVYMAVTFDESTSLCAKGANPANGMQIDFSTTERQVVGVNDPDDALFLKTVFRGSELSGKTVLIQGNYFQLRTTAPVSDGVQVPYYGFKISDISYYYDEKDVVRDGCIDISQLESGESGSPERSETIFVSTAEELIALAKGNTTFENVTICLTDDIDLGGNQWPENAFQNFSGVFDGQDHKISHFACINGLSSYPRRTFFMWETNESAILKNIRFDSFGDSPPSTDTLLFETGIVDKNQGKIFNVTVDGFLCALFGSTSGSLGGIARRNSFSGEIYNCHVTGIVYGASNARVGGIAGQNDGVIDSCTVQGHVIGREAVGGICGENTQYGIVSNCSSAGFVYFSSGEWAAGTPRFRGIGGVVGNQGGNPIPSRMGSRVKSCYTTMAVHAGKFNNNAGTFAASLIGEISSCYNNNLYARRNVALSNVIEAGSEYHRIVAPDLRWGNNEYGLAYFWNCFAWDGMKIGPFGEEETVESQGMYSSGSFDGMDVSKEEVRTKEFWERAGFDFENGDWHWEDGKMPYTSPENIWNWPEWLCPDGETESAERLTPAVIQAPKARSLSYSGNPIALMTEGIVYGGVVEYSLEEDGEYFTQIPEEIGPGTYTVWYRIKGDEEHADLPSVSIEVRIGKRYPLVYPPYQVELAPGSTLQSIDLPEGWAWQNPDTVLVCGNNSVACVHAETETERELIKYVYITLLHDISYVSATSSSCSEEGHEEHWKCSVCNELFTDESAETPTTLEELQIEKLPHTPGKEADCTHDQTCTVCGEVLVEALGHTPDRDAADCTNDKICTTCEEVLEAAKGHTPGDEATCTEAQTCTVCGEVLTEALGHTPDRESADCTHAKTCTTCREVLEAAKGHDRGPNPDCTKAQKCTVCGIELEAALGHTPGKEATCVDPQTCTVCGSELAPATGVHQYAAEVTDPTCTEQGYTTHTCEVCGNSYQDSKTGPLGHRPGPAADCTHDQICTVCETVLESAKGHAPGKEATCAEPQICTECGAELKPATGVHELVSDLVKPATCTENGRVINTCIVCGYKIDQELQARGHNPDKDEATCTEDMTCTVCQEVLEKAKGHTPGKEATCTEAQLCTECGEELKKALGHSFKAEVTQPTCTEPGFTTHTCERCGKSFVDTIVEPLGHDWSGWTQSKAPTCTETGEEKRECSRCDKLETRELEMTEHTPGEWKEVRAASETEEGLKQQTCTVCGAVVAEETIPKLEPSPTSTPTPDPTPTPTPTPTPDPTPTPKPGGGGGGTVIPPAPIPDPDPVPDPEPEECDGGASCVSHKFTDLNPSAWYHKATDYVISKGLMSGTSTTEFSPNATLTRAMLVTILWRSAGSPKTALGYNPFRDVPTNQYYYQAVMWAYENNVVAGTTSTTFSPNSPITREQLAAILWRYAGGPATSGSFTGFKDSGKVSSYAEIPMRWALEKGIVSGKGNGILDPRGKSTRAEAASMLMRYCEGQQKP